MLPFILIINSDRPVDQMNGENDSGESRRLTVFAMSTERGRWIFVALGLVINVCLGSIYSWSVFRLPLQTLWSIDATASLLPFIFFLAFFALPMPFAGGPLDRYGPRRLTMLGGITVGVLWILACQAPNIAVLTLAYGIIGGAGVGIAYNAPPSALVADGSPTEGGSLSGLPCWGSAYLPGYRAVGQLSD